MVHDVKDLIDGMRELSISEKKGFEEAVKVEAEVKELPEHMPLYNLVNALTSTARAAAPARRLELEGLAGDVLSAARRERVVKKDVLVRPFAPEQVRTRPGQGGKSSATSRPTRSSPG